MTQDEHGPTESETPGTESPFSALYDRGVETLLDISITEEWVETDDGHTHLLTAGDPSAPPLVVFQGANVTNPVTLAWVQSLADDYYLIAPDTPGEPGKTTTDTPPAFGPWVVDILDQFGLDSAAMIGASHGAGVLLEAAAHAPARIDAAVCLVPAGFGTSFSLSLGRIVGPSFMYRFHGSQWLLDQALAPMFTQEISSVAKVTVETIGKALRTGDLPAEFPGPDDSSSIAAFDAPTLVITAEDDPFFPGKETCKRASEMLQSLEDCLMLTDERHFLSPAGQNRATERIQAFLATHTSDQT